MMVPGVAASTRIGEQLSGLGLVRIQGKLERDRTVKGLSGVGDQGFARTLLSSLGTPFHALPHGGPRARKGGGDQGILYQEL